jgi:calcineurin-like phosphoesterase family protein
MNEVIIENWNKTVKPNDIIYHLGDVAFGGGKSVKERIDSIMPRLMGRKRLILGNHDADPALYAPYFEKIMSYRQFGADVYKVPLMLCHFPLHMSDSDYHQDIGTLNIHGHIHNNLTGHPAHINVCVEHTNYAPVNLEDIVDGKFRNTAS